LNLLITHSPGKRFAGEQSAVGSGPQAVGKAEEGSRQWEGQYATGIANDRQSAVSHRPSAVSRQTRIKRVHPYFARATVVNRAQGQFDAFA
jgi:hypothetical protein